VGFRNRRLTGNVAVPVSASKTENRNQMFHQWNHGAAVFADLNDIRLFVTVVRKGAVTRGAEALGMPQATVSRRLAALEREVGARLIERSSRRFELTQAGRAYHAAASRVIEDLEAASAEVAGLASRPAGHLRVAAPPDFATAFLAQPVASFVASHPDITIELDLSPRRVDLIDDNFDLAVRMGALADSQLVSRRLASLTRSLYASPAYAKRFGLPGAPEDLSRCRMVTLDAYARYGQLLLTRTDRPSIQRAATIEGQVSVNSMTMLRHLLLAGAGIGLVPDRLMDSDVRAKRALRVLPQWQAPAVEAHALVRSRALLPARVRLFLDHLAQSLATPPRAV
jgi:DNA-binding transcriptional LysR family regulator